MDSPIIELIAPYAIAVLSDTHNQIGHDTLDRLKTADEIWHLGDVSNETVYRQIAALETPLHVVQGNTDRLGRWPGKLKLTRFGHRFQLEHYPPSISKNDTGTFLHGHLHVPSDDSFLQCRVLSPGAITGPRQGSSASFAWIRFNVDHDWTWSLETV